MKTKKIEIKKAPWLLSIPLYAATVTAPMLMIPEISFAAQSNCPIWAPRNDIPQGYPAGTCFTNNSKVYENQWWASGQDEPSTGEERGGAKWDSPWVLTDGEPTPPDDDPVPPDDDPLPPDDDPAPSDCPIWEAKAYPKDNCVTYQGVKYKTQWWANASDVPHIGTNSWDSPWVLADDYSNTPPSKPAITPIADSTIRTVTLNWSITDNGENEFIKGISWSIKDTFDGSTETIYPSTTTFATSTATEQSGSAELTLEDGDHNLVVQLCTSPTVCTTSDIVTVNVDVPPAPVPGTPVLSNVPSSTDGTLNISWSMEGTPGKSWEVLNNDKVLKKLTQFSTNEENEQAGSTKLNVENGTYSLTVRLQNEDGEYGEKSNIQVATVSGAPERNSFFMAYYPSWHEPFHNAFCENGQYKDYETGNSVTCSTGDVIPDTTITGRAALAGAIPDYVTHVVLAFAKLNEMHQYTGLSNTAGDLGKLGMQFTSSSKSIKEAIRVLKQNNPGTKVLLAMGGATYNDSWNNVTDTDIDKLAQLTVDLGLDGLDVDYEIMGADEAVVDDYYNAIVNVRNAVDKANEITGGNAILAIPGWSTGADCTIATQGDAYPDCDGQISYWGGSAGRERQVMQGKGASEMIDLVSIMSYDAGYQHFDPIVAYHQYKAISKPGIPIAIGVQPGPDEGSGGAITLVEDKGIYNACVANVIQSDQYDNLTPGTYSIERFANVIKENPGDGMMMWSLFAYRHPQQCGSVTVDTVTEIGRAISEELGIGSDRSKQIDWQTLTTYTN